VFPGERESLRLQLALWYASPDPGQGEFAAPVSSVSSLAKVARFVSCIRRTGGYWISHHSATLLTEVTPSWPPRFEEYFLKPKSQALI
jgi:hypothetical protein